MVSSLRLLRWFSVFAPKFALDQNVAQVPVNLQPELGSSIFSFSSLVSGSPFVSLFYCDGAFSLANGKAAAAVAMFNSSCALIDGVADQVGARSVLGTEAFAIRTACLLGSIRGCQESIICSDSKRVIELSSWDLKPPWEIAAIIDYIRAIEANRSVKFIFIPRNCNFVAHWVLQASIRGDLPVNWVSSPPSRLQCLISKLM